MSCFSHRGGDRRFHAYHPRGFEGARLGLTIILGACGLFWAAVIWAFHR